MVELKESLDEFGSPQIEIKDPTKSKSTYTVYKTFDGFAFYGVKIDKGVVPKCLESKYTKLEDAEKAVIRYLSTRAPSSTVKREENTLRREQQKLKENS